MINSKLLDIIWNIQNLNYKIESSCFYNPVLFQNPSCYRAWLIKSCDLKVFRAGVC